MNSFILLQSDVDDCYFDRSVLNFMKGEFTKTDFNIAN